MSSLSAGEAAAGGIFLFFASASASVVASSYRDNEYIDTSLRLWRLYSCVTVADCVCGMLMAILRLSIFCYVVIFLSCLSLILLFIWERRRRLDFMLAEHEVPLLAPEFI